MSAFSVEDILADSYANETGVTNGNNNTVEEWPKAYHSSEQQNLTQKNRSGKMNSGNIVDQPGERMINDQSLDDDNYSSALPCNDAASAGGTTTNCAATFISQWAVQCLHNVLQVAGSDGLPACKGTSMSCQHQELAAAQNPLMMPHPPLALAAGNAFPLFQHMQKNKRIRTAFSPSQLIQLEQAFRRNQYLVGSERKQLARQLTLSETQKPMPPWPIPCRHFPDHQPNWVSITCAILPNGVRQNGSLKTLVHCHERWRSKSGFKTGGLNRRDSWMEQQQSQHHQQKR